ncbi:D-ala D-ala ligase N-terminal domain protein [Gleimia coleocanis DSM 15436]|uniref:D-alanine--D-alanine ligase n=1 Tax=Gleimia coleocanis DSM 15436 TaxID=525245 RepID=C0VXZ2_9ACTO|nr:D-alanine--D-alanine ligase [Gleimia coleocanis]EEH64295.1 D-ala D-ala ligase N-terminal domain protein [Gleimia coleocanis DSM 15436]
MADKMKILVVAGGLTHERDVSLRSGRRVANLLRQLGHTVEVCDLNSQFLPTVAEFEPDVVWPLIHGSVGEDGSIQDLLELVGFPYVGSRAHACVLASSKPTAKSLATIEGITTPAWISLTQSLFRQVGAPAVLQAILQSKDNLSFPLIVKPADGGSALGLSKVSSEDELRSAMVDAFAYGDTVMVEQFIPGREIAVSVVDLDELYALPPVEIVTDDGRYDYDARYNTGRSQFFAPARLTADETAEVQRVALEVHELLGLRHLSRVDLILGEDGQIYLIDVNVAPGMTDTSLFPQAAEAAGSFRDILGEIAAFAVSDK